MALNRIANFLVSVRYLSGQLSCCSPFLQCIQSTSAPLSRDILYCPRKKQSVGMTFLLLVYFVLKNETAERRYNKISAFMREVVYQQPLVNHLPKR
jgi:hypothetical protein